jgi:hypothetical protein
MEKLAGTLGKEVVAQREKSFLGQLRDALGDIFNSPTD